MRAILLDLMFTIVVPKELNRWKLYQSLLQKHAHVEATIEQIERAYREARSFFEDGVARGVLLKRGHYRRLWTAINARLIRQLKFGALDAEIAGLAIYDAVMGDPTLYNIPEDVRAFFDEAARRGSSLVLVTNQERAYVERFLAHFEITERFCTTVVSEIVGYQKPDPMFFKAALQEIDSLAKEVAVVVNNPRNDMEGAAGAGVDRLFLYDPRGEHAATPCRVPCTRIEHLVDVFPHLAAVP